MAKSGIPSSGVSLQLQTQQHPRSRSPDSWIVSPIKLCHIIRTPFKFDDRAQIQAMRLEYLQAGEKLKKSTRQLNLTRDEFLAQFAGYF